MNINIIVARDNNNGIGFNNELLYHIKEDMKYFKELTTGNTVLMGRKTYESIGKPLPNRENIIITSDTNKYKNQDISICRDISQGLVFALLLNKDLFIIGGDSIYKQYLPLTDKLYITQIDSVKKADTFFEFNENEFKLISSKPSEENGLKYSFDVWERIKKE